jgi:hypothetical protein
VPGVTHSCYDHKRILFMSLRECNWNLFVENQLYWISLDEIFSAGSEVFIIRFITYILVLNIQNHYFISFRGNILLLSLLTESIYLNFITIHVFQEKGCELRRPQGTGVTKKLAHIGHYLLMFSRYMMDIINPFINSLWLYGHS